MKTLKVMITAALILAGFAHTAQADEKIISRKVVSLPVDLSTAGVRSSNAGYGSTYLVKILVPGLAAETILNHRNEGESAPCLATYQTRRVDDIIKGNPATEVFDFEITQKKVFYPIPGNNTCYVTLEEDIQAVVRGYKFVHNRSIELPQRHIDDCK